MSYRGARRSFEVVAGSGVASDGAHAAAAWFAQRKLSSTGLLRWHVEIAMDIVDELAPADFDERVASRFHVDIYSEEWGFFFCHAGRASWIRITDVPFVHGRDDFELLSHAPSLKTIVSTMRSLAAVPLQAPRRRSRSLRSSAPSIPC